MRPPRYSDMDSELPLSQYPDSAYSLTELFTDSEESAMTLNNPEFQELYDAFNTMLEEEENRTEDVAPDLPPEDDHGNTEYKLKLCGLTMFKVRKRTT